MVRHAPIHRRSGHSDIAICCGRNVRGSSPSTSVVPLSNQVTTLNHKRFKGFKMFSDGHLENSVQKPAVSVQKPAVHEVQRRMAQQVLDLTSPSSGHGNRSRPRAGLRLLAADMRSWHTRPDLRILNVAADTRISPRPEFGQTPGNSCDLSKG